MDELELIRRCVSGYKQAWDEFVERYSRLIYSYIISILKEKRISSDTSLAEEIFQEIFLHLIKDNFKKLSQFKGRSSFSSWLKVVVINFVLDFLKKKKYYCISLEEPLGDNEDFTIKDVLKEDRRPLQDEVILEKETLDNLSDCIQQLDIQERFFIEMHIYRGMKLEELRKILKLSRSAIDMRKQRMIEKLRNCFRKRGFLLEI